MAEATDQALREASLQELLNGYRTTTHTNYIATGGFALVIFDYFYTLPEEIRFIWPSALSIPKVLFFVLRYYVFVNNILALLYNVPRHLSPEQCQRAFERTAYSTPVLTLGAEAMLFIRAYAFGGRGMVMRIYLIIQFLALHSTAFVFLVKFVRSAQFIEMPYQNMSCMFVQAESHFLGGVFALLLGGVFVVFLIIAIALYKHRGIVFGAQRTGLLTAFYQDGMFYFVILGTLLIANILVNFIAPEGYKLLFIQFTADMHSVISTRMLLHLREWAERDQYGSALGTHAYTLTAIQSERGEGSLSTIMSWSQVVRRMRESRGNRAGGSMRMLVNDGLEWSTFQTKTPLPVGLGQSVSVGVSGSRDENQVPAVEASESETLTRPEDIGSEPHVTEVQRTRRDPI